MIIAFVLLAVLAAGGAAFAFMGGDERSQKRVAAVARPAAQLRGAGREQAEAVQKRAKNIAAQLKDIEQNQARKKEKPTMRRRLEQAGFPNATRARLLDHLRHPGRGGGGGLLYQPPDAAGDRYGRLRRRLRPAALGAVFSHQPPAQEIHQRIRQCD